MSIILLSLVLLITIVSVITVVAKTANPTKTGENWEGVWMSRCK